MTSGLPYTFAGRFFVVLLAVFCASCASLKPPEHYVELVPGKASGRATLRGHDLRVSDGAVAAYCDGNLIYLYHPAKAFGSSGISIHRDDYDFFNRALQAKYPRKVRKILIDPGHGGPGDPGAVGRLYKEKDLNLLLAKKLASELKKHGYTANLTRQNDSALSLDARGKMSKDYDVFISLHHNASTNDQISGIECYSVTPSGSYSSNDGTGSVHASGVPGNAFNQSSRRLAYLVQKNMNADKLGIDRGAKIARFRVLTMAECPAILFEAGFVSNPEEERQLGLDSRRNLLVRALVRSVIEF